MSERTDALGDALRARFGDRASRHAAAVLIDLLKAGWCIFRLDEIPRDHREGGILVRVARELEEEAERQARAAAWLHDEQAGDASAADAHTQRKERDR